jgi:hypothetical protein
MLQSRPGRNSLRRRQVSITIITITIIIISPLLLKEARRRPALSCGHRALHLPPAMFARGILQAASR